MRGERWLTATPDGWCGAWHVKCDETCNMVVFIEAGKLSLQFDDDHYDTEIPTEKAQEVAIAILEQSGRVSRGTAYHCLAVKPWQKFVLGDCYEAGMTVHGGRLEMYPADSADSVWCTRQTSRELAFEILRQQIAELPNPGKLEIRLLRVGASVAEMDNSRNVLELSLAAIALRLECLND